MSLSSEYGYILVVIEADRVTSCVRNWPNCINSKFRMECGRSTSTKSKRDIVRGLVNGAPVTDVTLQITIIILMEYSMISFCLTEQLKTHKIFMQLNFTWASKYHPRKTAAINAPCNTNKINRNMFFLSFFLLCEQK